MIQVHLPACALMDGKCVCPLAYQEITTTVSSVPKNVTLEYSWFNASPQKLEKRILGVGDAAGCAHQLVYDDLVSPSWVKCTLCGKKWTEDAED